jgi:hypothetical protein
MSGECGENNTWDIEKSLRRNFALSFFGQISWWPRFKPHVGDTLVHYLVNNSTMR